MGNIDGTQNANSHLCTRQITAQKGIIMTLICSDLWFVEGIFILKKN